MRYTITDVSLRVLPLLALSLLAACQTQWSADRLESPDRRPVPPGTVVVPDAGLYADQTEISNLEYREYVAWLRREAPDRVQAALPDSTVWCKEKPCSDEPFRSVYYRSPHFDDYPVVGVSQAQAEAYSEWRTDRVAEQYLARVGYITSPKRGEQKAPFTLAAYRDGTYPHTVQRASVMLPVYRLPSREEWQMLTAATEAQPYGLSPTRKQQRYLDKNPGLRLINARKENPTSERYVSFTAPTESFLPNRNGLYNLFGNVAEWVAEPNVAKGGSYYHLPEEARVDKQLESEEPQSWIGFRCVATYERIEVAEQ